MSFSNPLFLPPVTSSSLKMNGFEHYKASGTRLHTQGTETCSHWTRTQEQVLPVCLPHSVPKLMGTTLLQKSAPRGSQSTDFHLFHTPRLFFPWLYWKESRKYQLLATIQTPSDTRQLLLSATETKSELPWCAPDVIFGKGELSEVEDEKLHNSKRHYTFYCLGFY